MIVFGSKYSSGLLAVLCLSTGLWAGWSGVRVPDGTGNFSLPRQDRSGAHPGSYPSGTRGRNYWSPSIRMSHYKTW